jgi:hypothetical protein
MVLTDNNKNEKLISENFKCTLKKEQMFDIIRKENCCCGQQLK